MDVARSVNDAYLAQCIASIPEDRLIGPLKPTINEIFSACLRYLSDVNFIRVAHALETLAVFLREIFKKRFAEQTFTIITLVAGNADSGDAYFKKLICDVSGLLTGDNVPVLIKALGTSVSGLLTGENVPVLIKALRTRLFLMLLTATDNVNANPVASYLLLHPITDPLLSLLTISPPHHRQRLEFDTSLVLLLLLLLPLLLLSCQSLSPLLFLSPSSSPAPLPRLFLVLLTATDNVNANPVASYLLLHPITDPLLSLLTLSPPHHRQRLEFDTSLVLLLLLLWRRASNPYADRIASSANAPLVPLLHTIHSLLSLSQEPGQGSGGMAGAGGGGGGGAGAAGGAGGGGGGTGGGEGAILGGISSYLPSMGVISSQASSALSVVAFATSAATQALYSYASTAIGGIASGKGLGELPPITSVIVEKFTERGSGAGEVDGQWAYGTCGVLLLYFLVALNPTARSPSLWPHEGFIVGPGKSLSLLWGDCLRLLLLTCRDAFDPHALQGEGGLPRAKVLFLLARLLLEERHTAEFLFRCDPATFLMHSLEPPSPSSPGTTPPSLSSPHSPHSPHSSSHPLSSVFHAFFNQYRPFSPTPHPSLPQPSPLILHSYAIPPRLFHISHILQLISFPPSLSLTPPTQPVYAAMSPRSPRTPSHPRSSMSHAFFNMGVAVLSLPLPPTPTPAQPSFNTLPPSISHTSNPPTSASSSSSSSHPSSSSSHSSLSSTPSSSSQPAPSMDPDALVRAAVVVSLVLNFARAKGVALSTATVDWFGLWRSLIRICDWCRAESNFQRPGVPEVAEISLGLLEACVGAGADLVGGSGIHSGGSSVGAGGCDDLEMLHALLLAHMGVFEGLQATAERITFGAAAKVSITGGITLVNIKELRDHYEVQAAGMGMRLGSITEEQALTVIRKKGMSGLKVKPRHVGPTHVYSEGTAELRILTAATRLLVVHHRKNFWSLLPKLELENY
ncbi:unnamed protein product [Closterium sp. NIES-65]|nr:unnamed protein product [Closterium sp. NIES-65]